ncbi:MAG: amidohydrolase family protein [Candidatus Puniceispirillaceae bacterium]
MQIDAHHHFWQPTRGDYGWIPEDNDILNRAYGPADIAPHLAAAGIDATILVQAAPSIYETEYMLGIADATQHVAGVTGWVDFENQGHKAELTRLAGHPKLRAVRPMIQDIPDDDWMLRRDVQWGFEMTAELGLRFEALGFPRHIENFLTIFKRYPDMKVVINHCMKPQIAAHDAMQFKQWADGMARLANETSAFCKFSALITEADENWQTEALRPYAEHIITSFGAERVMWGSDWPVCRLRGEYAEWREAALALTAGLGDAAIAAIFGGTANNFYDLGL